MCYFRITGSIRVGSLSLTLAHTGHSDMELRAKGLSDPCEQYPRNSFFTVIRRSLSDDLHRTEHNMNIFEVRLAHSCRIVIFEKYG